MFWRASVLRFLCFVRSVTVPTYPDVPVSSLIDYARLNPGDPVIFAKNTIFNGERRSLVRRAIHYPRGRGRPNGPIGSNPIPWLSPEKSR